MRTSESSESVSKQPRPPLGRYCLLDTPDARVRLAAMTTMASMLAHEVNQPLAAATNFIHASARRLRQKGEGFEDVLAMIEEASQETVKAGEIIRRMRAFIVTGKVSGRRENLSRMVEDVAAGLARPDGEEVDVAWSIARDARFVIAERVQIEQVLANILQNACEVLDGRSDRRVAIEATRQGGEVVIAIRDSGPGLTGEVQARLFEPLFTTKKGGLGLGLPICRTIVEAHGGRLWADSPAGGGARFSLSLPAAD